MNGRVFLLGKANPGQQKFVVHNFACYVLFRI